MSDDRLRYDGRVAVVTGAGAGLGREYALLLGSRGAKVVVNDLGGSPDGQGASQRAADIVVDEIKALGGTAVADYNSVVDGAKVIETAIKNFGRIDILINNAGILRDRSIMKISDSDWNLVNDVHLKGSFKTTQAAWPHMKKQKYGRIIMTSSNSGMYGNFGQANYSAAKMGLIGLTNTVALEGCKYNIHCNAILPTAASRLTQGIMPDILYNELKPELIAPVVAYLVHESCENNATYIESAAGWATKLEYHRGTGIMLRNSIDQQTISPETVRDNWPIITDMEETQFTDPLNRSTSTFMKIVKDLQDGNLRETHLKYPYSTNDAILYALSIGASVKNEGDLKYLYENHPEFTVFPTFYIYPEEDLLEEMEILLRAFDYKINMHDIVAGEYYAELYNELPTSGVLHQNIKVVDTINKGSGALCVKHTEITDEHGKRLQFTQYIGFVRNSGKFARSQEDSGNIIIPTVPIPDREPDSIVMYHINEDTAALHRLLGDPNPHNIDPKFAVLSGFTKPVLHGLCTLGIGVRVILQQYANNNPKLYKAVKVRFSAPVHLGDTMKIEMWQVGQRIHFRFKSMETGKIVIDRSYVDLKEPASAKL